jgi:hypothetical protein
LSQAEISQLNHPRGGKQDIPRFHIGMNDARRMDMLQPPEYIPKDGPNER